MAGFWRFRGLSARDACSGDPRGLEYSPLGTLIAEYRPTNAHFANDIVMMVPEPGSMGLLSLAFAGLALTRRRRRR